MKRLTLMMVCLFALPALSLAGDYPSKAKMKNRLMPPESFSDTRSLGGARPVQQNPRLALRLQFDLDSARLKSESIPPLTDLAGVLQSEELRGYVYRIEGHTCDLGETAYNKKLSHRRAKAVQDFLRKKGVYPDQLRIVGMGESQPDVPNTGEANRKKNRRVVIINTLEKFDKAKVSANEVEVQLKHLKNQRESVLSEGEVLTRKDNYAVEFKAGSTVHMYIYQVDDSGQMDQIFPNPAFSSQTNPIQADRLYRVPKAGNWFYVSGQPGTEHIVAFAHPVSISEPEALCRRILDQPLTDSDTMMASRSASKTRALGGVREEPSPTASVEASPADLPETAQYVWKRSFTHR